MMRALALIARRPDLDREAFRRHYETSHVPLAEPLLDGLVHYVRNHVVEHVAGEPPAFDVLSEFGYAGPEDFTRVGEMLASPRGQLLRQDELRFMDRPRNIHFGLEPRGRGDVGEGSPLQGVNVHPRPLFKLAILSGRGEGAEREGFLRALDRVLAPHLARAPGWSHFATTDLGAPAPWDAASLLPGEDAAGASAIRADIVAIGGRACLVQVEACASRRSAGWAG